jgi:Ca-activated chloride channel family protein
VLKKTTVTIAILIILGLFGGIPSSWADLSSDWQKKLNEIQSEINKTSGSICQADFANNWQQHLNEFQQQIQKQSVKIGIAYGVEKKKWLEWAREEFKKTPEGKDINIDLIRMGSIEAVETILRKDADARLIHVWAPASSSIQNLLTDKWMKANCGPIISGTPLVYTPLVILMWKERYKKFITKYNYVDFFTLAQALSEPTGWAAIANKPEWGVFGFGHTTPTYSNSGLFTLVLMAYSYYYNPLKLSQIKKEKLELEPIGLEQVQDESFLTWLKAAQENIFTDPKTEVVMNTMLEGKFSEIDAIVLYENLALNYLNQKKIEQAKTDNQHLDKAEKPSQDDNGLKIIYPTLNVWNDNPYYILNAPWSSQEQRVAAKLFQDFLLSDFAQKFARDESAFRPASTRVPLLEKGNLFDDFQNIVLIDINKIPNLKTEVVEQLLKTWQDNQKIEYPNY